jgi:hypothetical protein
MAPNSVLAYLFMLELQLQLPITLILLGAGCWTFFLAFWKPQWLRLQVGWVLFEGFCCGCLWGSVQFLTDAEGIIFNASLAGLIWTGTAFYSRNRYIHLQELN